MIKKLGTAISEYSVRNKLDEEIPVYSVTNEQGFCTGYFSKDVASKDRTTYKIVPYGYFAYNPSRINVGSVDWQHSEERVIVSPLYVVFGVDESVDKRYLLHYLKSDIARMLIKNYASGSVRDNLKLSTLMEFPFNFRSLEEQKEIANVLDKIDYLIGVQKQRMDYFDRLVKSRFIELFGDLDLNSMDWVQKPLGEVCEQVKRYPTFCNMEYIQSGVRVIRIGNILIDGHIDTNDENYVFVYEDANNDYPDTVIEENDIIMAVRGDGSAAKRIGIVTEPKLFGANISPNLIRIKAKQELLVPLFLFYYLTGEVGQARLDAFVNKTAKKNIAAKDIVKVITPIPPIKLQRQFAAFVAQTDKSKLWGEMEVAA